MITELSKREIIALDRNRSNLSTVFLQETVRHLGRADEGHNTFQRHVCLRDEFYFLQFRVIVLRAWNVQITWGGRRLSLCKQKHTMTNRTHELNKTQNRMRTVYKGPNAKRKKNKIRYFDITQRMHT